MLLWFFRLSIFSGFSSSISVFYEFILSSCFLLTLFSIWHLFTSPFSFSITHCFLFSFIPSIRLPLFIYIFIFILSGGWICWQCGNWTQAAPGTAGWDLCYKVGVSSSSALHAADGQQCNPWANCYAGHQQSQCWLGSHWRPNSLLWVLQVGGAWAPRVVFGTFCFVLVWLK